MPTARPQAAPSSSERKIAEIQAAAKGQAFPKSAKVRACPCCQGPVKKVQAVNGDGDVLFIGAIVDGAMDIESDGPRAYQCQGPTCATVFYLPG
jgi:hypothetical protein